MCVHLCVKLASRYIIEYLEKRVLFVRVSLLMDAPHKTSTIKGSFLIFPPTPHPPSPSYFIPLA